MIDILQGTQFKTLPAEVAPEIAIANDLQKGVMPEIAGVFTQPGSNYDNMRVLLTMRTDTCEFMLPEILHRQPSSRSAAEVFLLRHGLELDNAALLPVRAAVREQRNETPIDKAVYIATGIISKLVEHSGTLDRWLLLPRDVRLRLPYRTNSTASSPSPRALLNLEILSIGLGHPDQTGV